MRYSPTLEIVVALAMNEAVAGEYHEIEPEHIFLGILKFSEMDPQVLHNVSNLGDEDGFLEKEIEQIKETLAGLGIDSKRMRRSLRGAMGRGGHPVAELGLNRSRETKVLFMKAEQNARINGAVSLSPINFLKVMLENPTRTLTPLLGAPVAVNGPDSSTVRLEDERHPANFGELTGILKNLRTWLLDGVIGQDHAVHAFIEGLFNAEVMAGADRNRRRPKALFVFTGPPGVGKTYLAEMGARAISRPFRRFDMSGYADAMGPTMLAGAQRTFQGAKPGALTSYVQQNPEAILLFDEIEKADQSVIHLFLQILDQGVLEDKYTEKLVRFTDAIVIFTTNAGRVLYEDPNASGVHAAKTSFHRKTILSSLEKEMDPLTNRPIFPQSICSRLSAGYPILFNRLGVAELERIVLKELERIGELMSEQYDKTIEFGPTLPLCLVMREGARADARTVSSQTEIFVKTELFKFLSLHKPERLDDIVDNAGRIVFDLDPSERLHPDVSALLKPDHRSSVLLVVNQGNGSLWSDTLTGFDFKIASDLPEALNLLGMHDFDFVLLDLWYENIEAMYGKTPLDGTGTAFMFDHVPAASKSIHSGQELLRLIHEKHRELPCFLISFTSRGAERSGIDDELLMASVRSGGARGVVETAYGITTDDRERERRLLTVRLEEIAGAICRERLAEELSAQNKVVSFDTAPTYSAASGEILIRLRNLRIHQAVAAQDVAGLMTEAERPATRFSDVYGADQAKNELQYVINWLKNPRHYQRLSLGPPKGVLLFGQPGTGKTMLARALAGESEAAFIVETATNFVTKWAGSGPENVRNLFARARRYAPTILFIDEIDAIGKKRSLDSWRQAHEETLNSLLTEMDGFSHYTSKPIIVLAATNMIESLDPALRRRFDREIEVDKPDRAARAGYLSARLSGGLSRQVSPGVIDRLAGQSAGMTIADLEKVVQLAGRRAAMSGGVITDDLIEDAFETMRLGEAIKTVSPEALLRVARHEAGHCLTSWLMGIIPVQVTIVARGNTGGYVENEADDRQIVYTKTEILGLIRRAMGGRAAEIVFYGDIDGLSSGAAADLKQATYWAEVMVRDYGMDEGLGQLAIDPKRLKDGPLAIKVMKAAEKIVAGQLETAMAGLMQHREKLNLIVSELMEKNRLTRQDLEKILGDCPGNGRMRIRSSIV